MKKEGRNDLPKSKNTFLILSLSSLFLVLFFSGFASAAITVIKPLSNTNYSTATMFNVTYVNGTDFTDAKNATFYYNLSGSWVSLGLVNCGVVPSTTVGYCNGTLSLPVSIEGKFSINATLNNGTTPLAFGASIVTSNVTFDNRAPNVSFSGITNVINNGNYSGIINLNVSVVDGTGVSSVFFNVTNSSGTQVNFTQALGSGGYYNLSFLSSALADGMYNATVYANDSLNNLNSSQKIQFTVDNTLPTASYSCSPSETTQGQAMTCTCTPSDGNGTGINTALTSSQNPDTSTTGTRTLTCTFSDLAGNNGTAPVSYTIDSIPSYNPNSNSNTPSNSSTTNSYITVYAGTPAVIGSFDSSSGINQIEIEVNNNSYSVQISSTSYVEAPSAVTVKSGDVYQYIHIETQNLLNNLKVANLQIRVNKTWVSQNSLTKDNIALFRYNDSSSQWNELPTTYLNESSGYYYYNIQLTGFSYFAIAQETLSSNNTQTTGNENTTSNTNTGNEIKTNYTGLFIVLGILVLAGLVIGAVLLMKKIKR